MPSPVNLLSPTRRSPSPNPVPDLHAISPTGPPIPSQRMVGRQSARASKAKAKSKLKRERRELNEEIKKASCEGEEEDDDEELRRALDRNLFWSRP